MNSIKNFTYVNKIFYLHLIMSIPQSPNNSFSPCNPGDELCNTIAGCPITINTLYNFYKNTLNYFSQNKSIAVTLVLKKLAYTYAPLLVIVFIILLTLLFTGSIGIWTFLVTLLLIVGVIGATLGLMYWDYNNLINNINNSKTLINQLLFASYSESDGLNKFKCFS